MGRYIKDAEINQPFDVVSMLMDDYVYHNKFSRTDWRGEPVYMAKDAHGKERYLKWHYTSGVFHVEAWMKNAFGNETDLTGSGRSKKEFREGLEKLLKALKTSDADMQAGRHIGFDPLHHEQTESAYGGQIGNPNPPRQAGQPVFSGQPRQPVFNGQPGGSAGPGQQPYPERNGQGYIGSGNLAGTSLTVSIIAFIFSFIFAFFGLFFGVIGFRISKKDEKTDSTGRAKIAKGLSIAAIVISMLILIFRFFLVGLIAML